MPFVALFTDFGTADPYAGVLEAVIARLAPEARVLHLCHGVPPQDLVVGALWLDEAVDHLPPGTLVVAVVDPGVGSARALLACEIGSWTFLCPDNGLLTALLERLPLRRAVRIERGDLAPAPPSRTFHGRDLLAPAAARLATGLPLEALGPPCGEPVRIPLPRTRRELDLLLGEVVWADRFGNLVTCIRAAELPAEAVVQIGEHRLALRGTYAEAEPGALLALVGSSGRLEIAVRDGDAARELGVGPGEPVIVAPGSP